MSDPREPPPGPSPSGDDGVRVAPRRRGAGRGRALGLLVLAVVAGIVGWRLVASRAQGPQATPRTTAAAGDASHASPVRLPATAGPDAVAATGGAPASARPDGEDPTPDLSDYVLPGEAPAMAEVIAALHRRGIRTGLGAFQPHGTSPPLVGLEVPAGFPLPEGYVRHHQATDDGQRIAPILMFHPDVHHVDVGGRGVAVPADRVVPPELAPPGMPRRVVRIPPPRDGGGGP